ncbi:MAG: helix-hairpin-helix domain-containing protein [Ruminococcus sp.]
MTGKTVRATVSAAVILVCSASVLRIFAGEQNEYEVRPAVRVVPEITAESVTSEADNTIRTEIKTARSEISEENTEAENELIEEDEYIVQFPLDLNAAGFEELKQLPGIGEELAANIIEYRDSIGGFCSRQQLLDVRGIGTGRFNIIYDLLYINGEICLTEDGVSAEIQPTEYDGSVLDVNKATAEEFAKLPGADIELGRNIVLLREEIGGFSNILELLYAEGMTEELYVSIDEFLVCEKEQY